MDSLIWYTGIFRIKSGILESSQESRNPAKIPKDSESRRRKFIVSGPSPNVDRDMNATLNINPLNIPVTNLQGRESDEELLDAGENFHPGSRLWTVTYVCVVALQCFFILGFAGGFTSPVLSELSDVQDGYRSLRKKSDQDLFNVRNYSYKIVIILCMCYR